MLLMGRSVDCGYYNRKKKTECETSSRISTHKMMCVGHSAAHTVASTLIASQMYAWTAWRTIHAHTQIAWRNKANKYLFVQWIILLTVLKSNYIADAISLKHNTIYVEYRSCIHCLTHSRPISVHLFSFRPTRIGACVLGTAAATVAALPPTITSIFKSIETVLRVWARFCLAPRRPRTRTTTELTMRVSTKIT